MKPQSSYHLPPGEKHISSSRTPASQMNFSIHLSLLIQQQVNTTSRMCDRQDSTTYRTQLQGSLGKAVLVIVLAF